MRLSFSALFFCFGSTCRFKLDVFLIGFVERKLERFFMRFRHLFKGCAIEPNSIANDTTDSEPMTA